MQSFLLIYRTIPSIFCLNMYCSLCYGEFIVLSHISVCQLSSPQYEWNFTIQMSFVGWIGYRMGWAFGAVGWTFEENGRIGVFVFLRQQSSIIITITITTTIRRRAIAPIDVSAMAGCVYWFANVADVCGFFWFDRPPLIKWRRITKRNHDDICYLMLMCCWLSLRWWRLFQCCLPLYLLLYYSSCCASCRVRCRNLRRKEPSKFVLRIDFQDKFYIGCSSSICLWQGSCCCCIWNSCIHDIKGSK